MWSILPFFRKLVERHEIHTNPYAGGSVILYHGTHIEAAVNISTYGFNTNIVKNGDSHDKGVYAADKPKITQLYLDMCLPMHGVILHLRFKAEYVQEMTYVVINDGTIWTGWKNNPGVDAAKIIRDDGVVWVTKDPNMVEIVGMSFRCEGQFPLHDDNYNTRINDITGVLTIHRVYRHLRSWRSNLRAHVTVVREGPDGSLRDIPTKRKKCPDAQPPRRASKRACLQGLNSS